MAYIGEEKLNLLLVDDSDDHLFLTKTRLEQEDPNLSVLICQSAEEALDKIRHSSVDCIVSDYEMAPGMDGMSFYSELKKRGVDKPFIFLTGQGNEELARKAFLTGIDDYFTKEVGFAFFTKLINAVRNAVSKHNVMKNLQYSQTFNENIVSNIFEGFSVQDSSGHILMWSKQMEKICRINSADVVGEIITDLFAVENGNLSHMIDSVLKENAPKSIVVHLKEVFPSINLGPFMAKVVPFSDPEERVIGYIILLLDPEQVSPASERLV